MKPWDKQKNIQKQELKIPDIHYIIDTAKGITDQRLRALYCLLYLTGARICEVVRKKGFDLKPDGFDLVPGANGKMKKSYKYIKELNPEKDRPSIKKKQMTFQVMKGREVVEIFIRNEKNRQLYRNTKSIPIPLDRPEYVALVEMIKGYTSSISMEEELFPFGYQYAYRLLKPYFNPHWFRHIRSTHLTLNNNLPVPILRKYMGWSDDRPATKYQEMRTDDILDKL